MITELHIKNYKSIPDLKLKPGRLTVLIGENGCGKSNILEAIAFASAASQNKLDNEFLVSRGIRVTEPRFMKSAFSRSEEAKLIEISVQGDESAGALARLNVEGEPPYTAWTNIGGVRVPVEEVAGILNKYVERSGVKVDRGDEAEAQVLDAVRAAIKRPEFQQELKSRRDDGLAKLSLPDFLIYSPENSALRTFEQEGQIQPLGIKGEGLFKLLKFLSGEAHRDRLQEIKKNLDLIDWFKDFKIPSGLLEYERALEIGDRYLSSELAYFDQRSANEGFLFLLFYFALFAAPNTPPFFAIDNIDASLNPKLCTELVRRLTVLARKYDKQVIMTTHNPAILDGLDLEDDEQRLFVIDRTSKGFTRARRVKAPKPIAGEPPVRLSEAFLRGILGGLPQNF